MADIRDITYVAGAGQQVFDVPFEVFDPNHISVIVNGQSVVFTYEDINEQIALGAPLSGGQSVRIVSINPGDRDYIYTNGAPWTAGAFNTEFDKAFATTAELRRDIDRAGLTPGVSGILPQTNLANAILVGDESGTVLAPVPHLPVLARRGKVLQWSEDGSTIGGVDLDNYPITPSVSVSLFERSVDTMAALSALTDVEKIIYVNGYAQVNDGGGGLFHWVPDSEALSDGSIVIAPDGHVGPGRYVRQFDYLTPEMFGARGDAWFSPNGTILTGSATLSATHVGKLELGRKIRVRSANGFEQDLVTTIAAIIDDDTVTLADVATSDAIGAEVYAPLTDDTAAFRRMAAYIVAHSGGHVEFRSDAIYTLYSTVGDNGVLLDITNSTGTTFNFNNATLYVDRDVRAEALGIFAFVFRGGENIRIHGGKLTTRSMTLGQVQEVKGMRWFTCNGRGRGLHFDMDCEYSIEALFVQRQPVTDPVSTRWRDLNLYIRAYNCTYGVGLADSGDNTSGIISCDGCFRSGIIYGVEGVVIKIYSRNHMGGDVVLTGHKNSGVAAGPLRNIDIDYIVKPSDRTRPTAPGFCITCVNRGLDGGTVENVNIRAQINNNPDVSDSERQIFAWQKFTDISAIDTTPGRGHIVRNVTVSFQVTNASTDPIMGGRLLEFFDPDFNGGNWEGEIIDNFTIRDTHITGADNTADILLGLAGHVNGPILDRVRSTGDILFKGDTPAGMVMKDVETNNIKAALTFAKKTSHDTPYFNRKSGGTGLTLAADTGIVYANIETNVGGANLAGGLRFRDGGADIARIHGVADGRLFFYTGPGSGTHAITLDASGNILPGTHATQNLGSDALAHNVLHAAASVRIAGQPVLSTKRTGYGVPFGLVESRAAFDMSTVTTAELAQFVKALYLDLAQHHGLLG